MTQLHPFRDDGAEQAVLGAALINDSACAVVCRDLLAEDLYADRERSILRAIAGLHAGGHSVDAIGVAAALGADTSLRGYLDVLIEATPSAANVHEYTRIAKDNGRRRRLHQAGEMALRDLSDANGDGIRLFGERLRAALAADAAQSDGDVGPTVTCMADVMAEVVCWLWERRIPLGKITMLLGDPGLGKTMLALLIASTVSRGGAFPDGCFAPRGNVVILTAEDGLGDTIRPRLDTLGADLGRIFVIEAVPQGDGSGERLFSLVRDVEILERVVRDKRASLVIIDPVDAYTGGVDSYKNAEVRGMLAPFARMLEHHNAAGLLVHHLNKGDGTQKALYRAGGSLAWVAAARSVLGVAPDPRTEGRNILLPVKLNLAAQPDGLGYRISDRGIEWDSEPVTKDVESAFSGRRVDSDLMSKAKSLLLQLLPAGEDIAQSVIEEGAANAGITMSALKRAKSALGIQSKRQGFGPGATWYWRRDIES